jgi:hypothetical protein
MPLLLGLLVVEALLLRSMARSPFTPWLLLAWPMGVYVTGWTLCCIWDRLTTLKPSKTNKVR